MPATLVSTGFPVLTIWGVEDVYPIALKVFMFILVTILLKVSAIARS
jgi:hypothetical protein